MIYPSEAGAVCPCCHGYGVLSGWDERAQRIFEERCFCCHGSLMSGRAGQMNPRPLEALEKAIEAFEKAWGINERKNGVG